MIFDDNDFEMELKPMNKEKVQEIDDDMMDIDMMGNDEDKVFNIEAWNGEELKKLKQGLQKYHDDWSKVSEYVGRDQQECIAQFLQLPINDAFLEDVEDKRDPDLNKICHPEFSHYLASSISNTNPIEHMLSFLNPNPKQTPSPFADATHPVLGQAASLSAVVNSELVNIASNAALQFVSKQQIISPSTLRIDHVVDTKMGRGIIQQIIEPEVSSNHNNNNVSHSDREYEVKFEWGSSVLKYDDIIDVVLDEQKDNDGNGMSSWQQYPQNVTESKAKAAGILGASALIAKSLKNHNDTHIQQLLQHLVLLQSQKVKAKLAHLEELWFVLQKENDEDEDQDEDQRDNGDNHNSNNDKDTK